ncbi:autotransporter assembly complex protein TamA [Sphingorhabdus sp. SMR4y]|uniref:autotransporter assembly complex protein TamA n=1 Tax=Sphingorhabdus sp. SMR4y TaxID=2584094 RepID=UPI000B605344|nr:BamA/TamA family outer membrane protein [Sphingorhabdus sp. SMR4y]ASK88267.1 translocation and assembly module TamA [Sphingorhabdus sp. SMR4y]
MGLTAYCRCLGMLGVLLMGSLIGPGHAQSLEQQGISAADEPDFDTPLDPDQPLTEFPDFGVEWPDLDEEAQPLVAESEDVGAERQTAEGETGDQNIPPVEEQLAEQTPTDEFRPTDALAETAYGISFEGLPEAIGETFDTRFDILSVLEQYRGDDANFAQIRRRAQSDADLVERLLRIEGYYDAVVQTRFEADGAKRINVVIRVQAGPQYKLDTIALPGLESAVAPDPVNFRESFGLQPGDIVNSDRIMEAIGRIDGAMAENGYPFAETGEPELEIDHAERLGDLEVQVTPGGRYNFGSIVLAPTDLFDADHVQMIARFAPGDIYQASDLEDLRRALIATGLVSTIAIDPVAADDPEAVDVAVALTPAPLRTVAGELGYGTGEGARAEVSWEHRNFFPPEGLIRATAVLATQEQSGSLSFRRNNYRRRDNILNGRTALSIVDRPAFKAQTFSVAANIERQSNLIYQKRWSWSLGVELLASREEDVTGPTDATGRDTYFIGALPGLVTFDASDDLLDPTRGFRLSARIAPEASLQDGSFFYVRNQFDGSAYFPVSDKIVLAGRTRLGTIVGAGNNRIAPSRRLYAGGGGSVRGYGYQSIGPRDANNDPVGGRSLVEFSLEARVRTGFFGGNFGVVPFIDAGNVYTSSTPDFSGMRYGAGLGVRYYSDFGPIRIDVGTPINPQPGDSRIAVYVSLGQAF